MQQGLWNVVVAAEVCPRVTQRPGIGAIQNVAQESYEYRPFSADSGQRTLGNRLFTIGNGLLAIGNGQ